MEEFAGALLEVVLNIAVSLYKDYRTKRKIRRALSGQNIPSGSEIQLATSSAYHKRGRRPRHKLL